MNTIQSADGCGPSKIGGKMEQFALEATSIDFIDGTLRSIPAKKPNDVISLYPSESLQWPVVQNPSMKKVLKTVKTVSKVAASILIDGESGTGKSMLARLIHNLSPRVNLSFMEVNCGSLSESLLESELFGHVRGAFTGAVRDKVGKFEEANGGTIFLDDINSASLAMQTKLLHVIEERCLQRVGGNRNVNLDVRLICASNRNLVDEVEKGRFREDLYFRINVVNLHLLPLRERVEEIVPLLNHFTRHYSEEYGKNIKGIKDEAISKAASYTWPGNVRELENVVERAVVLSESDWIDLDIGESREISVPYRAPDSFTSLCRAVQDYERSFICEALNTCAWDLQEVSRRLKISRSTLFNKIKRYTITRPNS